MSVMFLHEYFYIFLVFITNILLGHRVCNFRVLFLKLIQDDVDTVFGIFYLYLSDNNELHDVTGLVNRRMKAEINRKKGFHLNSTWLVCWSRQYRRATLFEVTWLISIKQFFKLIIVISILLDLLAFVATDRDKISLNILIISIFRFKDFGVQSLDNRFYTEIGPYY